MQILRRQTYRQSSYCVHHDFKKSVCHTEYVCSFTGNFVNIISVASVNLRVFF